MTANQQICICGAGTMGSGIAQVFAAHGFRVLLFDVNEMMLKKAGDSINASLDKLVVKKKMQPEEKSDVLANIRYSSRQDDCTAHLIVEAIIENIDAKVGLINQLFKINESNTIIVTNTSSLSLTQIAEKLTSPERFAGMHFFNPAPVMQLVEIISTEHTSPSTIAYISEIVNTIKKTRVHCTDAPGFIVNRVARPYYLESLYLVEKEGIDLKVIDTLMENTGFPMGPFKLMDLIGNDINYSVTTIVYDALNRPARLKPSKIQEQNVRDGKLGRKSGNGFYDYTS